MEKNEDDLDFKHNQNYDNNLEAVEKEEIAKVRLSWVDLTLVIIGIIVLYITVNLITLVMVSNWSNEKVLIYINGVLTQGLFALLILSLKKFRKWDWSNLGFVPYKGRVWLSVLGVYGLTMLFNMLYSIYLFTHGINPPESDVYTKLLEQTTIITYILNLVITVGLAPIIEETVFRGIVYGSLKSYFGKWSAAGISAILFSSLHLQLYGFIPRFALGLALAYLYERFNSLYPAIMMHAINNFIAITLAAWLSYSY